MKLSLRSVLTDNPPSPRKVGHTTGAYLRPLLFLKQWCGFFYVPQEQLKRLCHGSPVHFVSFCQIGLSRYGI